MRAACARTEKKALIMKRVITGNSRTKTLVTRFDYTPLHFLMKSRLSTPGNLDIDAASSDIMGNSYSLLKAQ
jgi:hypothetical protein